MKEQRVPTRSHIVITGVVIPESGYTESFHDITERGRTIVLPVAPTTPEWLLARTARFHCPKLVYRSRTS